MTSGREITIEDLLSEGQEVKISLLTDLDGIHCSGMMVISATGSQHQQFVKAEFTPIEEEEDSSDEMA